MAALAVWYVHGYLNEKVYIHEIGKKKNWFIDRGDLQYFKDGSHVSKTARGGQPYKRNVNVATKGAY